MFSGHTTECPWCRVAYDTGRDSFPHPDQNPRFSQLPSSKEQHGSLPFQQPGKMSAHPVKYPILFSPSEQEGIKIGKNLIIGIVLLIAFIALAAGVFWYLSLGSGFLPTAKAQEAVYNGDQQTVSGGVDPATNILMIGKWYGLSSRGSGGIDEIQFSMWLPPPGSPSIDLSRTKIVFSTPTTSPQILVWGEIPDTGHFTAKVNGVNSGVQVITFQTQVEIDFKVTPVPKNTKMNIELRPSDGTSFPFSKTTPASIMANSKMVLI